METEMKLKDAIRIIALHTGRTLEEVHDFVYRSEIYKNESMQDNKKVKELKEKILVLKNIREIILRETNGKIDLDKRDSKDKDELYKTFVGISKEVGTQKAYEIIGDIVGIGEVISKGFNKLFSNFK